MWQKQSGERERERERETNRQTDRQTNRQRETKQDINVEKEQQRLLKMAKTDESQLTLKVSDTTDESYKEVAVHTIGPG